MTLLTSPPTLAPRCGIITPHSQSASEVSSTPGVQRLYVYSARLQSRGHFKLLLWFILAGPILLEDYHLIEKLAQVRDVFASVAAASIMRLFFMHATKLLLLIRWMDCSLTENAFLSALCTPAEPVQRASSR